jgi:hypothetical protein
MQAFVKPTQKQTFMIRAALLLPSLAGLTFLTRRRQTRRHSVAAMATALLSLTSFPSLTNAALPIPGDLLVANSINGNHDGVILQIDPNTGAQTVWASGGYLDEPSSMAFDGLGNLIVADYEGGNTGAIIRINLATGQQTEVATGNWMIGTSSVNVEKAGTYLAINQHDNEDPPSPNIVRIDPTTGAQSVVLNAPARSGSPIANPTNSILDANGNMICANAALDNGTSGIFNINSQTGAVTPISTGGIFASMPPSGISPDPAEPQDILTTCTDISNFSLSEIVSVNILTGQQSVIVNGGLLQVPSALADDPNGDILVANEVHFYTLPGTPGGLYTTASIAAVDPGTGKQTLLSSGGLLYDPGAILYVPEPSSLGLIALVTLSSLRRRQRALSSPSDRQ